MTKFKLIGAALLAATVSSQALAAAPTINQYDWTSGGTGGYATKMTDWIVAFDKATDELRLDVAMGAEYVKNDGFWMVLSPGGNPKGVNNELAILYGDLINNKITVYSYNGANSNNSYSSPGYYLGTFANAFNFTSGTSGVANSGFNFTVDMTAINSMTVGGNANFIGTEFGANVGIWYHPISTLNVAYNGNKITSFGVKYGGTDGWFDTSTTPTKPKCKSAANGGLAPSNLVDPTNGQCGQTGTTSGTTSGTTVPEPASMALYGAGLIGLGLVRRRKAA